MRGRELGVTLKLLSMIDNVFKIEAVNVNLTPELENFVRNRVESGKYNSQSEVVREGLRLLMDREDSKAASLDYLRGALKEGLTDLAEGRVHDGARIFAEVKERLRAANP